jgi:hypothetical protein
MIAESNSVDVDMKWQKWLEIGIPFTNIIPCKEGIRGRVKHFYNLGASFITSLCISNSRRVVEKRRTIDNFQQRHIYQKKCNRGIIHDVFQ